MALSYVTLLVIIAFSVVQGFSIGKPVQIQKIDLNDKGTFKWNNCGSQSDPIQLLAFDISPDPIVVGQNASVSFKFTLTKEITGGSLALTIEKEVWDAWVEVPCVAGIGSCVFGNFCSIIAPNRCPPQFVENGIPCSCPAPAGTYSLPVTSHFVQGNGAPSWLTTGNFYVKLELKDESSNPLGCYEIYFAITN